MIHKVNLFNDPFSKRGRIQQWVGLKYSMYSNLSTGILTLNQNKETQQLLLITYYYYNSDINEEEKHRKTEVILMQVHKLFGN